MQVEHDKQRHKEKRFYQRLKLRENVNKLGCDVYNLASVRTKCEKRMKLFLLVCLAPTLTHTQRHTVQDNPPTA